ncbi:sulfite exporter TauE/SafE family protein [Neobacillus sp. PS3-40]|uniref:sulfite exporter TauE/SafE family protein n=1 Tax=Neobacillus sp. PS3-40 TaxID=3070679 RepID=UPI0027DF682A|nr:sulfite exporter TauE/SafE family protein [Neobacillus sp. PS3-40]WML46516.1 sulfite exporter TauE/SafE family protein [Neobacillus sp. PS3-40]
MAIALTMFVMGILLGFVGAGGSGFIIAILTVLFGVPIHTALGTSLAAMVFTTMSGAYSHFRQGNISVKTGLIVGGFGSGAAYLGSILAGLIPVHSLHWLTASMLFLSAVLLVVRLFIAQKIMIKKSKDVPSNIVLIKKAALVGISTGMLSGTFGIGAAPFIQIGLLTILGLSIRQSVGTTMLVILPIALAGGIGFYFQGYLNFTLLVQVLAGTMIGSYVGAKFTNLVPQSILKSAMVLTPIMAGLILLIR